MCDSELKSCLLAVLLVGTDSRDPERSLDLHLRTAGSCYCRLHAGKKLYTGVIRAFLIKTAVHPETQTVFNKDGKMLFRPMGNIELEFSQSLPL